MMAHPPVAYDCLADHILDLKANDNLKYTAEYESIEPGQQFTWDNSSMEVFIVGHIEISPKKKS